MFDLKNYIKKKMKKPKDDYQDGGVDEWEKKERAKLSKKHDPKILDWWREQKGKMELEKEKLKKRKAIDYVENLEAKKYNRTKK